MGNCYFIIGSLFEHGILFAEIRYLYCFRMNHTCVTRKDLVTLCIMLNFLLSFQMLELVLLCVVFNLNDYLLYLLTNGAMLGYVYIIITF